MGKTEPLLEDFLHTQGCARVPVFHFPITVRNEISKRLEYTRQGIPGVLSPIKPLLLELTQRKLSDPLAKPNGMGWVGRGIKDPLIPPELLQCQLFMTFVD